MKPLLIALLCALLFATPSAAGPNANGVLILTMKDWNQPPECTDDFGFLCECEPLDRCEDAVVRADEETVFRYMWVYMAFPDGASPAVTEVAFGIQYTINASVDEGHTCADSQESMAGWPNSGTGTILRFTTPQASALRELLSMHMWVGAYYGPEEIRLTPHPELGGYFADGSQPPQRDAIVDYGRLGFGGLDGYLPCPVAPVPVDRRSWGEIKSGVR